MLFPLNLTISSVSTEKVVPSVVDVTDVHAPLFILYSIVLDELDPKAFQQIVPAVSTLNVR